MKVKDLVAKLNKLAAGKDFNDLLSKAVTHEDFHRLVREYFTPHLQGLTVWTWAIVGEQKKDIIKYDRRFVPYINCRMHNRGTFSNLTFKATEDCGNIKLADIETYFKKKKKEGLIANCKQSIAEHEEALRNLHDELAQLEKEETEIKEEKCRQ